MTTTTSRRGILIGAAALAAGGGLLLTDNRPVAEETRDPTEGRALAFDENFAMLDPAIWFAGPKATTFDSGFYGRSAFSRIEGEEGFLPYEIVDDAAAGNGKALQISARYIGRPMNVPNYYGNNLPEFQWISGNIQTAKSDGTIMKGWRQGYFEVRMWVPAHPLSFPAFWLMNGRSILYPKTSIELDVIEHKGFEPTQYGLYLHEWGQPGEHHEGIGMHTGTDITKGYFRYGVSVDGGRCRFYFERKPIRDPKTQQTVEWTIGRAAEMDAQNDVFWPLITLALQSDVPFPNPLRDEDRETRLRVDYMRVYT